MMPTEEDCSRDHLKQLDFGTHGTETPVLVVKTMSCHCRCRERQVVPGYQFLTWFGSRLLDPRLCAVSSSKVKVLFRRKNLLPNASSPAALRSVVFSVQQSQNQLPASSLSASVNLDINISIFILAAVIVVDSVPSLFRCPRPQQHLYVQS
jgi:hypothetical protein